jgi:hypothetical protein
MTPDEEKLIEELERFAEQSPEDADTGSPAWRMVRSFSGTGKSLARKLSPCTKFLLLVVLPVTFLAGLMAVAMMLVSYFGIYLDFLRPFWSPFPIDGAKYTGAILVPMGLFYLYARCKSKHQTA